MGIPPSGGSDGRGWTTGSGYLHLPLAENGCTFYYDQDHYGPVSGGRAEAGTKGIKAVVGAGRGGCGSNEDVGLGGGTDGGGGGDGRDRDGEKPSRWEDNAAKITLGTEPNAHLDYDTGLEYHHLIMSTIGYHVGQLER